MLILVLVLLAALASPSDGFAPDPSQTTQRNSFQMNLVFANENQNDDESTTLNIIQKSMGVVPPKQTLTIRPIRRGLSGFSTDEELGFVAILTSVEKQKSIHVVISPHDKVQIQSAEGLCMVQLSGGMDLGTAVLPPDLLAQIVADELELESKDIRQRLQLLEVNALRNDSSRDRTIAEEAMPVVNVVPSTPERDAKLASDVVKFMSSVKNLPGVAGSTENQVLEAMKLHADHNGILDRQAFSSVLDSLRRGLTTTSTSAVKFELVVALDDTVYRVFAPTAFYALGLAFRYEREVQVSTDIEFEMSSLDVLSRFPKFRPLEELQEDARLMDGFIPSMYSKSTLRAEDRQD